MHIKFQSRKQENTSSLTVLRGGYGINLNWGKLLPETAISKDKQVC